MGADTPEYALWFDIETSGLRHGDVIMEVAAVLTRMASGFEELGSFCAVVVRPRLPRSSMSAFALEEHTRNGLLDDIERGYGVPLEAAEKGVLALVDRWTDGQVAMAGSGVGHFDHPFIKDRMPVLHARLTYYDLDIGPVRRLARVSGVDMPEKDHTHRATECVREALSQGRALAGILRAGGAAR